MNEHKTPIVGHTYSTPLFVELLQGRSINTSRLGAGMDAPLAERATLWAVTHDGSPSVEYVRIRLVGAFDRVLVEDLRAYASGPDVGYVLDGNARSLLGTPRDRDRIVSMVRVLLKDDENDEIKGNLT